MINFVRNWACLLASKQVCLSQLFLVASIALIYCLFVGNNLYLSVALQFLLSIHIVSVSYITL